ncbi:MAG TPA: hypothetical protein VKS21_10330, partial [Spirochaetota bacterium]|nr:hypothetical protein [Spirochaetota bacterium]
RIAFVNRATVNYRQHNANIIGAKRGRDFIGYFFSGSGFSFRQRIKKNISAAVLQAGALFRCYQKHLNEEQYCLLKSFLMMKQTGFFRKRYLFIKHRFFLQHPLRTLVYFLFM